MKKFGKECISSYLCGPNRSEGEKVILDSEPQFLRGARLSLGDGGGNGVSGGKVDTPE